MVEPGEGAALTIAADTLRQAGLRVVMPGPVSPASLRDLFLLQRARVMVCQSAAWQHAAYLTDTPTLRVNAPEPFSAYPIRINGLFTLRMAIDLDTGRTLAPGEQLTSPYLRNLRNHGHRDTPAEHVRDAVHELLAGAAAGWTDTAGQQRFRQAVADAADDAAAALPVLRAWGADAGFIGDGRLARCQADGLL